MQRARQIILFVFFVVCHLFVLAQTKEEQAKAQECKTNWEYGQLKASVRGEVLYHHKALALCGILSTASVTLVRTENGLIIRVLEMCNTDKDFKKGAKVKVTPEGDKTWTVGMVPFDPQACKIMKAYFGKIIQN
jgi:hypothetical protein